MPSAEFCGLNSHPVADLYIHDICTDTDDGSCRLVTEHERFLYEVFSESPVTIVVQLIKAKKMAKDREGTE
jgi:hypothetical protein